MGSSELVGRARQVSVKPDVAGCLIGNLRCGYVGL